MRIFITGVAGFIGSALARHLRGLGHEVVGSSHSREGLARVADAILHGVELGLASQVPAEVFLGCDAVVHCAYDNTPGALQANIAGTTAHFRAAERAGVPYQLFVSSHSARRDAVAEYGRLKFALEGLFLDNGQAVVRPGLVIGPGGYFQRQLRSLSGMPLAVLPGADRVPVFHVALGDLLAGMTRMLEGTLRGEFNLFGDPPATLREYLAALGVRRVLSVPLWPLFVALGIMRRCTRELPAALGRIDTMHKNLFAPVHVSNLRALVDSPLPLREAVRRARGA